MRFLVVVALALVACPTALADLADERALAERHAPIVRLVEQTEECGPGEPYRPLDVDKLFGDKTVALRGPWNPSDLVKIGPSADNLVDLYEYHLDFPGHALEPGCDYERWANHIGQKENPTVYSHVVAEPGKPGKLALQYWLFYAYNDWNNLHEGDWEMIQLVFDASSAAEALSRDPVEIGYSQHEGAERADWDDEKLEVVDGTRPVVYPAAGSHANFYDEALFIGTSGEQGVGCDDTRGPYLELQPAVRTIPSKPAEARSAFPWITYEGRWGELQQAFFNGPTGPNLKRQWTEPISWSEGWRDRAYAVPTSGIFGTGATDFFCGAVAKGSVGLIQLLRNPAVVLGILAVLVALIAFAIKKATWHPVAPLRIARRRSWGQILSASATMYVKRIPLFLGIGVLLVPITLAIAALQQLLLGGLGLSGVDVSGEAAGSLLLLSAAIGTTLTLFGFAFVQAATARALVEIDAGRPVGPVAAYRLALDSVRPLLGGLVIAVGVWVVLSATAVLLPIAIWLAVRWALLAQAVELEELSGPGGLRRSAALVRRRWFRVGSLVGLGAVIALAAGPLIGAALILLTDAPLALLNIVAGIIYAVALPFVAVTTTYVYLDARARTELESADEVDQLPAEIALGS
jgi:hypothetical protein